MVQCWSEQPPFGNVALCADTDRMYHRIGAIGDRDAELPRCQPQPRSSRMARATGSFWRMGKSGPVTRATAIRFSVLWKAEVRDTESRGPAI